MRRATGYHLSRNGRRPFLAYVVIWSSCHLVILSLGCHARAPAPAPVESAESPWFQDITREAGLNFVHDAGPLGQHFLPEIIGSGAAFLDFDNDGRLDILLLQNGGPH